MEIRRLVSTDVAKLVEMVQAFRAGTPAVAVATRFLENDSNWVIAALESERIIGFVLGYRLQRYDGQGDMLYVHEVNVLESFRNRGAGKRLMSAVLQACRGQKFSKVFLITNESNVPAMRLYESTGARRLHDDDVVFGYGTSLTVGRQA